MTNFYFETSWKAAFPLFVLLNELRYDETSKSRTREGSHRVNVSLSEYEVISSCIVPSPRSESCDISYTTKLAL
jgi:hypothetical protein